MKRSFSAGSSDANISSRAVPGGHGDCRLMHSIVFSKSSGLRGAGLPVVDDNGDRADRLGDNESGGLIIQLGGTCSRNATLLCRGPAGLATGEMGTKSGGDDG